MTVPGVTVVPLVTQTREEQLQAEVNELHAKLEATRAELATYPHLPSGEMPMVVLGGGLIAEADGWLWLVVDNRVTRIGPATAAFIAQAAALRSYAAHAEAQSFAEQQRRRNPS